MTSPNVASVPNVTKTATKDKQKNTRKRATTRLRTPAHYEHGVYKAEPLARIEMIRKGVSPEDFVQTIEDMGVSKEKMLSWLRLSRATINRRLQSKQSLPCEQSERVLGLQSLIGQVAAMVGESGDAAAFNAARWLAEWLEQPLPALDNLRPAVFMDTMEGIELLSALLAQMQSGAYA